MTPSHEASASKGKQPHATALIRILGRRTTQIASVIVMVATVGQGAPVRGMRLDGPSGESLLTKNLTLRQVGWDKLGPCEGNDVSKARDHGFMGQRDHNSPPTEWCDWWTEVHQLSPDIAYGWVPPDLTAAPDDPNPWFWHWCSQQDRWMPQASPEHILVSREPLHMEPSLLWPCCSTHGFVRGGRWISA